MQVRFKRDRGPGKVEFDKSDPTQQLQGADEGQGQLLRPLARQPASTPVVPSPTVTAAPGVAHVVPGGFGASGMSPEQLNQIIAAAMANAQLIRVNPQQGPTQ